MKYWRLILGLHASIITGVSTLLTAVMGMWPQFFIELALFLAISYMFFSELFKHIEKALNDQTPTEG